MKRDAHLRSSIPLHGTPIDRLGQRKFHLVEPVRLVGWAFVIALSLGTASAQDQWRGSISFGLTGMSGRPAEAVERNMRILQFPADEPLQTLESTSFFDRYVLVEVATSERLGLAFLASRTRRQTRGTFQDLERLGVVSAEQGVTTLAATLVFRLSPWAHISAGPGRHSLDLSLRASSEQVPLVEMSKRQWGWVAGVHLRPIRRKRYFGEVLTQFRFAGTLDSGVQNLVLGYSANGQPRGDVVWPAATISFSHWLFGIGTGVEF